MAYGRFPKKKIIKSAFVYTPNGGFELYMIPYANKDLWIPIGSNGTEPCTIPYTNKNWWDLIESNESELYTTPYTNKKQYIWALHDSPYECVFSSLGKNISWIDQLTN